MATLADYRLEYQEANELFRHYQTIRWATIPIILTAFSLLVLTWQVSEASLLVFLGSVSIVLTMAFFYINRRYSSKIKTVMTRINTLEEVLNMHLHREIQARERDWALEWLDTVRSEGFYVVHIASVLLTILWVIRIVLALTF